MSSCAAYILGYGTRLKLISSGTASDAYLKLDKELLNEEMSTNTSLSVS